MPTLTHYHWDPVDDFIWLETDQVGSTIVAYTHEPGPFGPLLSENHDGTEYCHHYDVLGSTTFITTDLGTVTDSFEYDAWGILTSRAGSTPTPYQWLGRWGYQSNSLTGSTYVRARTYQPVIARWTSIDPLALKVSHEHSIDKTLIAAFQYCANSPASLLDPTGLEESDCPYCGPVADGVLMHEIKHAADFWAQHFAAYSGSFVRYFYYRSIVRWQHMLLIGNQLDWVGLQSEKTPCCGKLVFCPRVEPCARRRPSGFREGGGDASTYRICGRCVHDHFIGNLMFGFWMKLHDFQNTTTFVFGNIVNWLQHMGRNDEPWDVAGYVLGVRAFNAYFNNSTLTESGLCAALQNGGDAWYEMANETGVDYSTCQRCPKPLDGGVQRWVKGGGFFADYVPF